MAVNLAIAFIALLVGVASGVLAYRSRGGKKPDRCTHCWYDTAGLRSSIVICPECGRRRFDPAGRALRRRKRRLVVCVLLVFVAWGVLENRVSHPSTSEGIERWTLPHRVKGMTERELFAGAKEAWHDPARQGVFLNEIERRIDATLGTPAGAALRERLLVMSYEGVRSIQVDNYWGVERELWRRYAEWRPKGEVSAEEIGAALYMAWENDVTLTQRGDRWRVGLRLKRYDAGPLDTFVPDARVRLHALELIDADTGEAFWSLPAHDARWSPPVEVLRNRRSTTRVTPCLPAHAVPDPRGRRLRVRWDIEIVLGDGSAGHDKWADDPFARWRSVFISEPLDVADDATSAHWEVLSPDP